MADDSKPATPIPAPTPGVARAPLARPVAKAAAPVRAKALDGQSSLPEYPGHDAFLLNTPVYTPYQLPSTNDLSLLFFRGLKLDGHCPRCGRDTTFSSVNTRGQWNGSPSLYETVTLACARDGTHRLIFWIRYDGESMQKVGQFPSHADIVNDQSKAYRKVLSREDAAEFHRAIGLAAHGVGIGSFVYLRRIFERLIWKRFEEFKAAEAWDTAAFKQLSMGEKIAFLKDHLPDFLVENARLYGIMSLGVHELSDKDCLAFFPVLSGSIVTILEDDQQKRAELDRRAALKKAIQAFEGGK